MDSQHLPDKMPCWKASLSALVLLYLCSIKLRASVMVNFCTQKAPAASLCDWDCSCFLNTLQLHKWTTRYILIPKVALLESSAPLAKHNSSTFPLSTLQPLMSFTPITTEAPPFQSRSSRTRRSTQWYRNSRNGRLGCHCSSTSTGSNWHRGKVCQRKTKTLQAHLAARMSKWKSTPSTNILLQHLPNVMEARVC